MVDVSGVNRGGYNPTSFVDAQAQHLRDSRANPQPDAGAQPVNYAEAQQRQKHNLLLDQIFSNLAGLNAGRQSMPAVNIHQQNGHEGLVQPQLTGQQTNVPAPFDQRYASAANLRAIVTSLPPQMFQVNQQIFGSVDRAIPQMQRALKQPHTIYEQFPKDFVVNRANLAIQNKRLNSIYAVI